MTKDDLKQYNLQLFQPKRGYRYSLDPIILANFCDFVPADGTAIDLGAGCGIISLLLARINLSSSIVAVENNPEMAGIIDKNIQHNSLSGRVSIHIGDVLNLHKNFSVSSFDLVVSNPPFRTAESGKVSPHKGRDSARHETTARLADFLLIAKYLVKPKGKICFIHLPSRLPEFMALAAEMKLSLLRLRMVHNDSKSAATMFMAELGKGRRATPVVEAPLFVNNSDIDDK